MPNMQTKLKIYTGLLSLNRAVVSWQEITALTRSYSQWLYLHTDHGARRIAPRRQRPDPTAPGSWTHTYSNNISQGDLNPIEHVWDQLGRAVQARLNANSTRADLRRFLVDELDRLPQDNVQRLVFHPECFKNEKVPLLGPYPPVHIPLRGH